MEVRDSLKFIQVDFTQHQRKKMKLVILHLSDIHIKYDSDEILKYPREIAQTLFDSLTDVGELFIIVSGDIAYSGKTEQYDLAITFFSQIEEEVKKETNTKVSFIICPGNHDCNFEQDTSVRQLVIADINKSPDSVDIEKIKLCTSIQNEYFIFRDLLEPECKFKDDLLVKYEFNLLGYKVTFNSLNISWMSKLHESQGYMSYPIKQYEGGLENDSDLTISIMHHPLNWFHQTIYRDLRYILRKSSDLIITGHEHIGNIGTHTDAESGSSAFIEGTVLQNNGMQESAFNIIKIDIEEKLFCSRKFQWDKNIFKPINEGSWLDWHHLNINKNKIAGITDTFLKKLEDPGAYFVHQNVTELSFSDIYIYPDLVEATEPNIPDKIPTNSQSLLFNEKCEYSNIILKGEEKSGKTSLLFQLFKYYHANGNIPVYISFREINYDKDKSLTKFIEKSLINQYGEDFVILFNQTSSKNKILLLDDFDDTNVNNESTKIKILDSFSKIFGKIFVTVGDMFEINELFEVSDIDSLPDFNHFTIQPFGYKKRSELIRKWFLIGQITQISESDFIGLCDQSEKLMDSVMTKMVIPSVPIYLLTLLQSITPGSSGDFQNSSLAEYYRYLLVNAFMQSGVKKEKLGELLNYSSHLAWTFHKAGKPYLSIHELREFNQEFSEKWHTIEFDKIVQTLTISRVLIKSGDEYSFHYPYIYYYFKGLYMGNHINDLLIRDHISHCCKHLYVRDYAKTILFVAHHSSDDFIINSIINPYNKLFSPFEPVEFNGDTKMLNTIISESPDLPILEGTVNERRERNLEVRDKIKHNDDGLIDQEEDSDELSLIAQITMLFKSAEILGQVLKNQYSQMTRQNKIEYLSELFNGPLRALANFYDFIYQNPDLLTNEIEKDIANKANVNDNGEKIDFYERKKIAQQVSTQIIQIISFSFIVKAGRSASSEGLLENVRDTVKQRNTVAFKLIELAILLDSPKPIPKSNIQELLKEVNSDLITTRLINMLIYNRLYMFKVSEKDMQWLYSSPLKLDLGKQHSINYGQRKNRFTK